MKLIYPKIGNNFNLVKGKINSIVIEDPFYYEDFILSLYNQINKKEESLELFLDNEKVDLHKYCELVISPMDLTFDKKEFQKKLYSHLSDEAELNDLVGKLFNKYGEILSLLDELGLISDYPIEFNNDLDVTDVLKHLDVHIMQPEGRFIERLIEYGKTVNRLLGKNILIIANCAAFLDAKEYKYLQEWAAYEEVYVLLLNNRQNKLNIDLNEFIIDVDLCELH